jgi:DNA-binding LacI/PurR family transcriptional regulator
MRKTIESKTSTTSERVAQYRERLKEAGVKRLDLSISSQAYESLKAWAEANQLTNSEAAEELFLAASAPLSTYTAYATSNDIQGAAPSSPLLKNTPDSTTAVAAFFANRQPLAPITSKEKNHGKTKKQ